MTLTLTPFGSRPVERDFSFDDNASVCSITYQLRDILNRNVNDLDRDPFWAKASRT